MGIALFLALSLLPLPAASAAQTPSAETIIERSVEANQRDWRVAPRFDYKERDRDAAGHTRTYDELMVLGSPYERLTGVDGEPISAWRREAEEQKLEAVIARREAETPEERAERMAKYEKSRKRDHLLMEQLAVAFRFQLEGETKLEGRPVYVLKATPRPDYQPPNMEAKVLTGMEGTLWIDEASYQWVRVQAKVIHPVNMAGVLASVEPGTQFLLEKAPVEKGIWLASRFTMRSEARVFFFFRRRSQKDEMYYGYRPAVKAEGLIPLLPDGKH